MLDLQVGEGPVNESSVIMRERGLLSPMIGSCCKNTGVGASAAILPGLLITCYTGNRPWEG